MDGPVSQDLGRLVEVTLILLLRFAAIVFFTPVFVIPSLMVGGLGRWCGQMYMKVGFVVQSLAYKLLIDYSSIGSALCQAEHEQREGTSLKPLRSVHCWARSVVHYIY